MMKINKKFLLLRFIYEVIFALGYYKGYCYINNLSAENLTSALQKLYYGNVVLICILICHIVNLIVLIISFADKRNWKLDTYSQFKILKKLSAKKVQCAFAGITAVLVFVVCAFGLVYPMAKETTPKVKCAYTTFIPSAFFGTDSLQDKEINIEETFAFGTNAAAWFQYNSAYQTGQDDFLFNITYAYNCQPFFLSRIMDAEVQKLEKTYAYYQDDKTEGERDGIKYLYIHLSESNCYEVLALYEKQYLHAMIAYPEEQSNSMLYENYILDKCLDFIKQQAEK